MDSVALVTVQPGATPEVHVYSSPDVDQAQLTEAGHLLADGADPPMQTYVVALEEAKWGSL